MFRWIWTPTCHFHRMFSRWFERTTASLSWFSCPNPLLSLFFFPCSRQRFSSAVHHRCACLHSPKVGTLSLILLILGPTLALFSPNRLPTCRTHSAHVSHAPILPRHTYSVCPHVEFLSLSRSSHVFLSDKPGTTRPPIASLIKGTHELGCRSALYNTLHGLPTTRLFKEQLT